MNCYELLGILPGITSVIGSGGKTSLLTKLSQEVRGTVILTTSTHILPFPNIPLLENPTLTEVSDALITHRVICVGAFSSEKYKLGSSALSAQELASVADYVFVEADGSKRLPLKAHASHEPVIPEGSQRTVQVIGLSGFGLPIHQAAHRSEIFCNWANCLPDDIATPTRIATVIAAEHASGAIKANVILVNQTDNEKDLALARDFTKELHLQGDNTPVIAGSLFNSTFVEMRDT